MSISPGILAAAADPATGAAPQPGLEETLHGAQWLVPITAVLVALVVAAFLGVFRPRSAGGPLRVDRHRPAWPLLLVTVTGLAAWFGMQVVYLSVKQYQLFRQQGPQARLDVAMLSATDYAFLSTIPFFIGFACLMGGDLILGRATLGRLGFGVKCLPAGVLKGVLGTLLVLPVMWWVLFGLQWAYQQIGYQHPAEHDLLRAMTQTDSPVVEWLLIAGAVLFAPVFEEYLFRGHVQTVVRELLVRMTTPLAYPAAPLAYGLPPVMAGAGMPPGAPLPPRVVLPPDPAVVSVPGLAGGQPPGPGFAPAPAVGASELGELPSAEPDTPRQHVWQTWVAILVTSLVFAGFHAAWMFPPIFFLSVCLGYAYERTGSLWAAITIHALFNTTSTVYYLLSQGS